MVIPQQGSAEAGRTLEEILKILRGTAKAGEITRRYVIQPEIGVSV
jgi:predicted transcriptional regulator